jgi:hypothetical protein
MSRILRVAIFGFSFTVFAMAHHSTVTVYQMEATPITLKGTVTKVEWQNPHIWCYIDVTDDAGNVTAWEVEIQANPNAMFRNGWTKDSLRVGDLVTVEGLPPRDTSLNRVLSRALILPDGRELGS